MSQRSQQRTDQLAQSQHANVGGINAVTHSVELSVHSGPLPSPAVLREFEEILPGSAERIFAQFETQSSHRRSLELLKLTSDAFSQRLGTVSASLIGLLGVIGGLWLTHEGKGIEGLAALFGTLAGLVGTFLYQRKRQDQERDQKQNPQNKN